MVAEAGPSTGQRMQKRPRKGARPAPQNAKKAKKVSEKQRIEQLELAVQDFVPPDELKAFTDLPISDNTKRGLKKASFVNMTDIQAESLPVSLKGKDVLGAARTGSGKTLAFLIPVLDVLYRRKWGPQDGLGALIISPTRELAVQIFDVLRSIGGYHSFSAGLVIGGKNLKDESDRLSKMNILVATPGRLLQHLDQTAGFDTDSLQMLVLDEADRILDMGFQRTLSALLSHLPKTRQTLLFSATQTSSVADLARLSLHDPVTIGVQEASHAGGSTPAALSQHYTVCVLDKKLDLLWSFIKTHLHSKTLVFLSSCKQVRFVFEAFCRMHPGVPLLHLHGKQKQTARLDTYARFARAQHAVLLATDIAARGLDFAKVDWVVQVDAPEDAETYIHRVGRTARYESGGSALLLLCPSEEEGMVRALEAKGVQVAKIKVKGSKTQSIGNQLQSLAFQDPEIKYLGQRAFVSYLRSVHLHKDKSIFKVAELPVKEFAASLGLPGAPKVKFLSKEVAKQKKNASRVVAALQQSPESDEDEDEAKEEDEDAELDGTVHSSSEEETAVVPVKPSKTTGVRTKYDRMFERKNQNVLSEHYTKLVDHSLGGDDDEEDFITLKRADHDLPSDGELHLSANISNRKLKMGQSRHAMLRYKPQATKLVFDDEGKPHELYEMKDVQEVFGDGDEGIREAEKKFTQEERERLAQADVVDREVARDRRREKKRKRKERERGDDVYEDDGRAELAPVQDDGGYVSPDFDLPSASEDEDEEALPPPKRSRQAAKDRKGTSGAGQELADEEQLALQVLRGRR